MNAIIMYCVLMKEIITPIFRTISYPQTIVNHRVLIMYYVKCNKHDFINMTQYDFIDQSSRCLTKYGSRKV